MSGSCGKRSPVDRKSERGESRVKFLVTIAVLVIVAYVGYQYVPVAYQAYLFKDLMQHDVNVAATQGYPGAWVKEQLTKNASEYGVPPSAIITPTQHEGRMEVRVQFIRPISLLSYTYQYDFDHTAKSTEFFTAK